MEHQKVMSYILCERGVHGTPKGDVLCFVRERDVYVLCERGMHGTPKCDVLCLV